MELKQSPASCSPLPSPCASSEDTCPDVHVPLSFPLPLLCPKGICRSLKASQEPDRLQPPKYSFLVERCNSLSVLFQPLKGWWAPWSGREAVHPRGAILGCVCSSSCADPEPASLAGRLLLTWWLGQGDPLPVGTEPGGGFCPCGIWPWISHALLEELVHSLLPPVLSRAVINAGPASLICIRSPWQWKPWGAQSGNCSSSELALGS